MRRVLFVDDEPRILEGLRRMLRPLRHQWEMSFANSGQEAVAMLGAAPFDVVVTDMRMPGMDGAALLEHVQQHHPNTVRIVLSGHASLESALRVIPIAHRFLGKPCEAEALHRAVNQSSALLSLLSRPDLAAFARGVRDLPVAPTVYQEICAAMRSPDTGMQEVARIANQDPALCAEVLKIVNSGYFGLQRPVGSVEEAITFLGLAALRDMVLTAGLLRQAREADSTVDREAFIRRALLTGRIARSLLPDRVRAQEALTAGTLHDIGHLVLGHDGNEQVHHAELGGYLLGLWNLPFSLVEAVACHHQPSRLHCVEFGVTGAVHVGQAFAKALLEPVRPCLADVPLDQDFLVACGVTDRVEGWWTQAVQLADGG